MTWTIQDDGFCMTLGRAVPGEIERAVHQVAASSGEDTLAPVCAVHPGGAAILDAVEAGLGRPGACAVARQVLRLTGNTSSGAVLRVLDRTVRALCNRCESTSAVNAGAASRPWGTDRSSFEVEIMAFGPGLTMDRIQLQLE